MRGHLEARECGIHFIVGSEILLTTAGGNPHVRLVLLAQDRRGYGNLCELITLARRRAPKGTYVSLVADVEGKATKAPHLAGMPGCLAFLLPVRHATIESLFAQAMWIKIWFPDRAWIVAPRPMEQDDDLRSSIVAQVAEMAE